MVRPKPPAALLQATPEETEAEFYEALQQGDLARLMAVWADEDEIVCVHPGGPRVVGAAAIRASFGGIFSNGGVPAWPEQVHKLHSGGTAVHHLVERISIATPEGTQTAWVLATNVYLKTALGWRLAAHHASPGGPGGPEALQAAADFSATLH